MQKCVQRNTNFLEMALTEIGMSE